MRVERVAAVRVEVVAAVRVWVVWLGCGGAGWGFLCRMANSGRASCPAPYKSSTGCWGGKRVVSGWIAEKRGKVVFSRSLFLSLYEKIMV